jgi:hypothetical protein
MRFYGAIRGEPGKAVSDDAFACLGGRAILLDGADNAHGSAQSCVDFLTAQLAAARPDMPLNELVGDRESVLLGRKPGKHAISITRARFVSS